MILDVRAVGYDTTAKKVFMTFTLNNADPEELESLTRCMRGDRITVHLVAERAHRRDSQSRQEGPDGPRTESP